MKIYCEHGALSKLLRSLQRKGFIELVHFPYDPDSDSSHIAAVGLPSEAQICDLNLPWSELPGTWNDYCGSVHLSEIQKIVGLSNRRDALHVDSAFKSRCAAFVTSDRDILAHKERLEALLGIRFFDPDADQEALKLFVTRSSGAG